MPRGVFEGLAQEILSECSLSVGRASALIRRAKRSELDGLLFSISQLLTLREQIAPFDSDFAITHRDLDFTQTRQAVRSLLGRGGKSIVELLQSGAPSLVRSHRDAKAALDVELRQHCEAFIKMGSDVSAKPILDLLSSESAASASGPAVAASAAGASPLQPAAVAAAVSKAEAGVRGELRRARNLMAQYLPEKATQGILFGPIRANVLDALGQLETLIHAQELATPQRTSAPGAANDAAKPPLEAWPERLARIAEEVNAMADGSAQRD